MSLPSGADLRRANRCPVRAVRPGACAMPVGPGSSRRSAAGRAGGDGCRRPCRRARFGLGSTGAVPPGHRGGDRPGHRRMRRRTTDRHRERLRLRPVLRPPRCPRGRGACRSIPRRVRASQGHAGTCGCDAPAGRGDPPASRGIRPGRPMRGTACHRCAQARPPRSAGRWSVPISITHVDTVVDAVTAALRGRPSAGPSTSLMRRRCSRASSSTRRFGSGSPDPHRSPSRADRLGSGRPPRVGVHAHAAARSAAVDEVRGEQPGLALRAGPASHGRAPRDLP